MDIKIFPLNTEKMKQKVADENQLGFGKLFTDRMLIIEWKPEEGWHNGRIEQYAPFMLDPSCMVLHYAQEIFEGLKAYKLADGRITLFRPEMNAKRFNRSADRMSMPELPVELFLDGIEKIVALEKDWIPSAPGTSLYIRPAMIAVEPGLGVRPANHFYFFVILSPVGAYYSAGFNPISILVEDHFVRAVPGGTGEAKTGGNYASSIKAAMEAKKKGYEQVLWLDACHKRYVEEVGSMNMFFAYGKKIVTAELTGSILSGITRDSVKTLAKNMGYEFEERQVDIHELTADIKSGKLTEAFGSGTAAVITPVGTLCYKDEVFQIGNGAVGELTQKLYDTLTGIQTGVIKDEFGWVKFIG